jgi:hypothetical protein
VWIGLFGFKEVRTRAGIAAGLIEVAAFATLALAAAAAGPARQDDGWVSSAARRVARVHSAVSMVIGGVGAVSVLALALLGVAVAHASGPTYDGHPLYTYIGDDGPGLANGNNLDLNGGLWYEVRVSGS